MAVTLQSDGTADTEKIKLLTKEKTMERSLYCFLSITLFLSKQTCRGHREDASSFSERSFLETIELFSKYDLVLKEHFTENSKRDGDGFIFHLVQKSTASLNKKKM